MKLSASFATVAWANQHCSPGRTVTPRRRSTKVMRYSILLHGTRMIRECIFLIARAISRTENIPRNSMKCCAVSSSERGDDCGSYGRRTMGSGLTIHRTGDRCREKRVRSHWPDGVWLGTQRDPWHVTGGDRCDRCVSFTWGKEPSA